MVESERFAPRHELGRTGFVATVLGIGDLADRSVRRASGRAVTGCGVSGIAV